MTTKRPLDPKVARQIDKWRRQIYEAENDEPAEPFSRLFEFSTAAAARALGVYQAEFTGLAQALTELAQALADPLAPGNTKILERAKGLARRGIVHGELHVLMWEISDVGRAVRVRDNRRVLARMLSVERQLVQRANKSKKVAS